MKVFKQGVKFGVVGVGNTLLTAAVIWIMRKYGCADVLANITGYLVGLINSYIWNRQWTFQSTVKWKNGAIRFLGVFAVCYLLQLGLWNWLNLYCPHPPLYGFFKPLLDAFHSDISFYNQMIGMVFFTVINFIINKFYTFKA